METMINVNQMTVSEIELTCKPKIKASQRPKIGASKDAYDIFLQSWDTNKIEFVEQFKILLMNRANKVLGLFEVSTGGVTGSGSGAVCGFSHRKEIKTTNQRKYVFIS